MKYKILCVQRVAEPFSIHPIQENVNLEFAGYEEASKHIEQFTADKKNSTVKF